MPRTITCIEVAPSSYDRCEFRAACDDRRRTLLVRQLEQAQASASGAVIAIGLAHDLKNVLTTVRLHADLIGLTAPADARFQPNLAYIREAVSHAGKLLDRLAAFTRAAEGEVGVLQVEHEVRAFSALLEGATGRDIELVVETEACPPVRMDPVELQQIVLNCVLNSRDALAGAGTITVAVKPSTIAKAAGQQFTPPIPPGEYVEVSVSDTAGGMAEEDRRAAADPFHRSSGKGWGVGLAVVHRCTARAAGGVRIASDPHGTCVTAVFPVTGRNSFQTKHRDHTNKGPSSDRGPIHRG
jgi:signal transduction histidine kinase